MSTFDYLSVLVSIVVGLGLSRVLTSAGELVLQRQRVRFHWVPLLMAAIVFLVEVEFWWSAFGFQEIEEWNFFSFSLLLLVSVALYMMSVLVLPDPTAEASVDLRRHFYSNHRWLFSLAGAYLLLDVSFDLAVGGEAFFQPVRYFQAVYLLFLIAAAISRNERVHQVVTAGTFTLFLIQIALLGLQIG